MSKDKSVFTNSEHKHDNHLEDGFLALSQNFQNNQSDIVQLTSNVVNKIAAGEVIEDPASIIKELIENSLDAQASMINIEIIDAGKTLIRVDDNGSGIKKAMLVMALGRHCTSKLRLKNNDQVDLLNIASLGFRGEALPSIASVSKMKIATLHYGETQGVTIEIKAGKISNILPCAFSMTHGTKIEVRDIFYNTPVRYKFLKSDIAINRAIKEIIIKMAVANQTCQFKFSINHKEKLFFPACEKDGAGLCKRIEQAMDYGFGKNAISVNSQMQDHKLVGFVSVPTYSRGFADKQYLFVNNRPVKDKLLTGVIRASYHDFLEKSRHPVLVLFLTLPFDMVDCNVHPSKVEVRFQNPKFIRQFLISSIVSVLRQTNHTNSHAITQKALSMLDKNSQYIEQADVNNANNYLSEHETKQNTYSYNEINNFFAKDSQDKNLNTDYFKHRHARDDIDKPQSSQFMGTPLCQLFATFIISMTNDQLIIVDAHAAHERIIYEKLKKQYGDNKIVRQILLVPEVINLTVLRYDFLKSFLPELSELGLVIEDFGSNSLIIREVPLICKKLSLQELCNDIADELANMQEGFLLKEKQNEIFSTMACHNSIRSGRELKIEEMDELLRLMEKTPFSGQCNHGRPTYVVLSKHELEKLFHRR